MAHLLSSPPRGQNRDSPIDLTDYGDYSTTPFSQGVIHFIRPFKMIQEALKSVMTCSVAYCQNLLAVGVDRNLRAKPQ
jgi:hypothetical protein